uniref:Armadillo repeat containing 3 n=1 Tax=Astyanax mexicanus TaxID=7994 RepID=W5LNM7_ASTMX
MMGKKVKKEAEPAAPRDAFDPLPIESKKAETVVLMLDSPEEEVLAKACEAIHRFAEKGDENRNSLLALGAVEPLTRLISHEDKTVRRNAFMAVGVMASNNDVRRLMKKLNIIPSVISKLSPEEDIIVHEFATLCLASLSVDFTCKVQIYEQNGLEPLLRLLSSPDPDVKKNSVECIFNLVQEFSDLHADALRVIFNCLEDTESVKLIQGNGGLEKLLQFVITPTTPEVQTNAVKAIARVAESSETRKLLHEQNVEKALIDLLATENKSVHTAVCQAVAVLSKNQSSMDTFRLLNGIKPIVQLLNSQENGVKEAAAQALSSLSSGNPLNAQAISEAEGEKLMVQILKDCCSGTVSHVAAILTNMASQEALRCSIITHRAIPALLEPLQSTEQHTLISTTQLVAALTCETEGRAELRDAGGLPLLVKMLQSNNTEICRNACWAVSVCANDEPTATEMCKLGALEILQEINCSLNRRSKFSEVALQRLLDSNPSIKYSLTGWLSHTDITADGFYDPGQARVGHRVPTLEDIAKQVINQHRAIIAVNGKPQDQETAEDRQQESPTEPQTSSVLGSKGSSRASKVKGKGRQEEEKQKDEDESKASVSEEKPWSLPYDADFHNLISEAAKTVVPKNEKAEMYTALAKLVCNAMGGLVDIEEQHNFPWELHISELKIELQSNIIPIGMIKKGTYYHRALLFKALADRIGVNCSLVRGDYNRTWNEVLLSSPRKTGFYPQPQCYIVDLMHEPGNLMKCGTPAAIQYQTI